MATYHLPTLINVFLASGSSVTNICRVVAIGCYENNRFRRNAHYFRGCGEYETLIHNLHLEPIQLMTLGYTEIQFTRAAS